MNEKVPYFVFNQLYYQKIERKVVLCDLLWLKKGGGGGVKRGRGRGAVETRAGWSTPIFGPK